MVESQINTQQVGLRPYGVGLLVAGYDVWFWFVLLMLAYWAEVV